MIGASKSVAFDLTAACSGFVVGLITAAQYVRTGAAQNVVVIGADALSRYVDWRDRGTATLKSFQSKGTKYCRPYTTSIEGNVLKFIPIIASRPLR